VPLIGKRHRLRATLVAVALVLSAVGVTLLVVGFGAQHHAPQPPASAAGTYAAGTQAPTTRGASSPRPTVTPFLAKPKGLILPRSTPTHLSIPAIGVSSSLLRLGLNSDHTVQVPPLGADSKAGWYRYSPSPGQLGPSILLGHIDSAKYGAGVFFKLGALRKGDSVSIRRADNSVAVFRVDAVAEYPKNQFPTLTVYGNTDHAALRLITCGGKFDLSAHSYEDNIVAFASLVSSHKA
jgi:Sortase domain